jgi:hypothetical protein
MQLDMPRSPFHAMEQERSCRCLGWPPLKGLPQGSRRRCSTLGTIEACQIVEDAWRFIGSDHQAQCIDRGGLPWLVVRLQTQKPCGDRMRHSALS